MIALGFLDVEADLLDPFRDIEIEHLPRRGHARRRQYRDHVERHPTPAQKPDTGDRPVERAAARSGHSVAVVQMPGAIDADPEIDLRFGEERAPGLVDQGSVGLERMDDRQIARSAGFRSWRTRRGRTRSAAPSARRHATRPTGRHGPSPTRKPGKTNCARSAGRRPPSNSDPADSNTCSRYCKTASAGRPAGRSSAWRGSLSPRAGSPAHQLRHQLFQLFQLSPIVPIGPAPAAPTADASPSPRCPTRRSGDSRRRA